MHYTFTADVCRVNIALAQELSPLHIQRVPTVLYSWHPTTAAGIGDNSDPHFLTVRSQQYTVIHVEGTGKMPNKKLPWNYNEWSPTKCCPECALVNYLQLTIKVQNVQLPHLKQPFIFLSSPCGATNGFVPNYPWYCILCKMVSMVYLGQIYVRSMFQFSKIICHTYLEPLS